MHSEDLKQRTKEFALRIIRLIKAMPKDLASTTIARQIIRSGTSVAANYRATCIAKSRADFINKLRICAEESDETQLWLELIIESQILPEAQLQPLIQEANELTSIFLSSIKTARENQQ